MKYIVHNKDKTHKYKRYWDSKIMHCYQYNYFEPGAILSLEQAIYTKQCFPEHMHPIDLNNIIISVYE